MVSQFPAVKDSKNIGTPCDLNWNFLACEYKFFLLLFLTDA
jgi:hypothetical protein